MKIVLNWSTGKDAAYALYELNKNPENQVVKLLTTISLEYQRVSMHGISVEVLKRQVSNLGLPIEICSISSSITMQEYEQKMTQTLIEMKKEGIDYSAYGDILLEDLKVFREQQLEKVNIKGIFPNWKKDTRQLLIEMIESGVKTMVICVNEAFLDKSFLGRVIDMQFLEDLPSDVDPCGENGEYHSFVFDGPMFAKPVDFQVGEAIYKQYPKPESESNVSGQNYGFWFLEIL